MFRFAQPHYLILLAALAPAAWIRYRAGIRRALRFSLVSRTRTAPTWRSVLAAAAPAAWLAGLALVILALARPQQLLQRVRRRVEAVAIMMVVDTSGSMEALDMGPDPSKDNPTPVTRLEAAKRCFADFVARRPHDLVGLVTFGGYASTRCPLTADHRALLHLLGAVKTPREAMREDGVVLEREDFMTAIGDALATACAGLRRAEPRSRLIVLLTDGKSNTGIVQPLEAMQAARQLGFRVYTIGVGTGGRTAFWDTDEAGRRTLRHADADVDHALLEHMATVTGGRYFLAADNDGLLDAMRRIDELEKTPVPVDIHSRYREGYPHLLAAALALLLPATVIRLWLTGSVV